MERAALNRELQQAWDALTGYGARFEVGTVEVRGRSMLSYANAPRTLADIWRATASWSNRDYLVFEHDRYTYDDAHGQTARVAGWLLGQGVRRGDRVAIAMRNYPEWLVVYWACVSLGFVAVGLNAWWTRDELTAVLGDLKPRVIFADEERLARLGETESLHVAVRAPPRGGAIDWAEVVAMYPARTGADIAPDDDACIFYTSGTTAAPKGVRLTHRNVVNNLMNMQFAAEVQAAALSAAAGQAIDLGAAPAPVGLATTPLFHVTATNCLAHPVTAAGGKLVLMHRWDAGDALRLIERERVTTMGGVPTMTRELLRHPDRDRRDLSSLTTLVGGGAPMPADLVAAVDAAPIAARPSTGFGMTEASGIVTAISGEFLVQRPESCGRPLPTFEVKIVDDAGRSLPTGQAGELYARSAGIFAGYYGQADATALALVDGWLATGDIAWIDADGFVTVVDRKKDLIIRGGENISCAEVEAALFRHPAVAEVCSFGIPDERLGEEVGAAIMLRPGETATACGLRRHLAPLLSVYKVPRYIWLLDAPLPRNATGKFLRRTLRMTLDPGEAL